MNVVMLDGEHKNETAEDEGDDIVHVGVSHVIGGSNPEEREEKERRNGGDGHGHGVREPPREYPRQNPQHVAAGTRGWSTFELDADAYHGAQEGSQEHKRGLWGENGLQA